MGHLNVAIVVLNYNDFENTKNLITLVQPMKTIDKIIVVDNNSTDTSYSKLIKYKNSKTEIIKSEKNQGYAYGNNLGIKYVLTKYSVDYIIVANPDIIFNESVVSQMVLNLQNNHEIAQIAPKMISPNGRSENIAWQLPTFVDNLFSIFLPIRKIRSKKYLDDINRLDSEIKIVDVLSGDFFMIKSKIFQEVGFFDDNTFLYGEEDILAFKIKQQGYRNALLFNESYIHIQEGTINKNIKSQELKFKYLFDSTRLYNRKYLKCNLFQRIIYFFLWHFIRVLRVSKNIIKNIFK